MGTCKNFNKRWMNFWIIPYIYPHSESSPALQATVSPGLRPNSEYFIIITVDKVIDIYYCKTENGGGLHFVKTQINTKP